MAKRSVTFITDDFDGTEDAETVTFSYQGRLFEIDLSAANREKLEKVLEPYISAARKSASGARVNTTSSRAGGRAKNLAAVRAWAQENGYTVNNRGRVPRVVLDAYDAAK
ncbi:histone-like nucleoid-structuring protein Lsr2 [Microbacterium oleivorans]|uniref:Lsr2 family protein n=1 Tax=Microbacterium oleivorans TaxID=273677 RepID=A0A7D5IYR8_9MICO|nr:Lsr2 family protein [Microbacterium oleivorans]QLD11475.1 Lsr2 family protein [Microbacterium oleivorans]